MTIDEMIEMSDSNLKKFLGKFEELKGQFVITDMWKVERFVAIGDDGEDYYYVTFDGKDLHWSSCVGRIIPLKGYLKNEDYESFIRLAKLNDYDQIFDKETFKIALDKYLATYDENSKFLTELCWDLN